MGKLIDMLPSLYQNSEHIKNIQNALEGERDILKNEIIEFCDNLFIDTSSWGLDYFEKFLEVDSVSRDIDTRKNVIKNKSKFRGITNIDTVVNLCSQYGFGEVEVDENFKNGKFTIRFISKEGEPENLRDLINQLDLIVPAHVEYDFHFTYVLWGEINNKTWEEVHEMTWDSIRKLDEKKDKLIAIPSEKTIPGEIYPGQGL